MATADAEFFEPNCTYLRDKPYTAPEKTDVFHCVAVATNPRNGEPRAFGFAKTANPDDQDWYSTALTPAKWDRGWVTSPEHAPSGLAATATLASGSASPDQTAPNFTPDKGEPR